MWLRSQAFAAIRLTGFIQTANSCNLGPGCGLNPDWSPSRMIVRTYSGTKISRQIVSGGRAKLCKLALFLALIPAQFGS